MSNEAKIQTRPELLARLRHPEAGQEEAAWAEFVRVYEPLIRAWCARQGLRGADVDDVTQDVLVKLTRELRVFSYDPDKTFSGWLRTVVARAVVDHYRARQRAPGVPVGGTDFQERMARLPDAAAELGDDVSSVARSEDDLLILVEETVRRTINPRLWQAFEEVKGHGRDVAEVAAELGMTYAAFCQAFYRCKRRCEALLAKLLEEQGGRREDAP